jgi:hypothetical protein
MPPGWSVNQTPYEWTATSPTGYMYISVTKFHYNYHTALRMANGNVLVLEVQSQDVDHLIPTINRCASLAAATEPPISPSGGLLPPSGA